MYAVSRKEQTNVLAYPFKPRFYFLSGTVVTKLCGGVFCPCLAVCSMAVSKISRFSNFKLIIQLVQLLIADSAWLPFVLGLFKEFSDRLGRTAEEERGALTCLIETKVPPYVCWAKKLIGESKDSLNSNAYLSYSLPMQLRGGGGVVQW